MSKKLVPVFIAFGIIVVFASFAFAGSQGKYLAPGVYVEEVDSAPRQIEGVSTGTASPALKNTIQKHAQTPLPDLQPMHFEDLPARPWCMPLPGERKAAAFRVANRGSAKAGRTHATVVINALAFRRLVDIDPIEAKTIAPRIHSVELPEECHGMQCDFTVTVNALDSDNVSESNKVNNSYTSYCN